MDLKEQRHKCRLCSKSFLCGRSLGGHMRSHMSSTSFVEESTKPTNGYGLRQKPNKTWRLSSSVSHNEEEEEEEEKKCRECGKEFHSWRALFGHMRCHSHDKITEEKEGSWSGGGEGLVRVPRRPRRPAAIAGPSSSSASEDHEQEDVAISLMMLSRDAGYWGSDNPAAAAAAAIESSSDKNSGILEEEEDINRDSDDFKKPKSYYHDDVDDESDDEGSRKRRRRRSTRLDGYGAGLGKSRYECTTCKKSFHSYQALGGHRASHKRLKGRCCGGQSSFDTDVDPTIVVGSARAGAGNNYQCAVCGKVFASGQALGGHKRSHLVMSTSPTIVIEEEAVVVMPELLDLNLPAPVDEDSSSQRGTAAAVAEFNSWWRGSNLKNEAMLGMIAN